MQSRLREEIAGLEAGDGQPSLASMRKDLGPMFEQAPGTNKKHTCMCMCEHVEVTRSCL